VIVVALPQWYINIGIKEQLAKIYLLPFIISNSIMINIVENERGWEFLVMVRILVEWWLYIKD